MILTKEQLYDMFQNILSVKKYEHQILYNAMQVRTTVRAARTRSAECTIDIGADCVVSTGRQQLSANKID